MTNNWLKIIINKGLTVENLAAIRKCCIAHVQGHICIGMALYEMFRRWLQLQVKQCCNFANWHLERYKLSQINPLPGHYEHFRRWLHLQRLPLQDAKPFSYNCSQMLKPLADCINKKANMAAIAEKYFFAQNPGFQSVMRLQKNISPF